MRKTSNLECDNKLLVDIVTLQAMLSCGKQSADKIGVQAGAVVRWGKRKLYNVEKIKNYINNISE